MTHIAPICTAHKSCVCQKPWDTWLVDGNTQSLWFQSPDLLVQLLICLILSNWSGLTVQGEKQGFFGMSIVRKKKTKQTIFLCVFKPLCYGQAEIIIQQNSLSVWINCTQSQIFSIYCCTALYKGTLSTVWVETVRHKVFKCLKA